VHAVAGSGQTGRASDSVSGVVDCSVLVGCDGVPDVSKGRVASIFNV